MWTTQGYKGLHYNLTTRSTDPYKQEANKALSRSTDRSRLRTICKKRLRNLESDEILSHNYSISGASRGCNMMPAVRGDGVERGQGEAVVHRY